MTQEARTAMKTTSATNDDNNRPTTPRHEWELKLSAALRALFIFCSHSERERETEEMGEAVLRCCRMIVSVVQTEMFTSGTGAT